MPKKTHAFFNTNGTGEDLEANLLHSRDLAREDKLKTFLQRMRKK